MIVPKGQAHARLPTPPASYHAFITDREGDTLELEADHRRHAEIENAIRDHGVGLNHLPSQRCLDGRQMLAHNLARWTSRIGLGEQLVTTEPSDDASSPWSDDLHAERHSSSPAGLALGEPVQRSPGCAPALSDAGKRYTNLILIGQTRERTATVFPAASDPPWVLPTPASGVLRLQTHCAVPPTRKKRFRVTSSLSASSAATMSPVLGLSMGCIPVGNPQQPCRRYWGCLWAAL